MKSYAPTSKDAALAKQVSSAVKGIKLPLIPPASIRSALTSSSRANRQFDKQQASSMANSGRLERDRQQTDLRPAGNQQAQQAIGAEIWPSVEQLFKVSSP